MIDADIGHVLATIMLANFRQNEPLKFIHGNKRLCHRLTNHSSFTTASADKASLELRSLPSIAERLQS
jgi:hypothetical protein